MKRHQSNNQPNPLLTSVVDRVGHGGTHLPVDGRLLLRRLEIYVGPHGPVQQRLRRAEVVAQRSLRALGAALH